MKNITYLLGAGASCHACPILQEQGEKMVQLALNLPQGKQDFSKSKPSGLTEKEGILWDIGYFGKKALEFGTVDTYARKLFLNKGLKYKLEDLKLAVSTFFTIWQLIDDSTLKTLNDEPYKEIDIRYITLLAAILEKSEKVNPTIKKNINIVTWNYDLQLEFAYKAFCEDTLLWRDIKETLAYRSDSSAELQVCHLNGYHGHYFVKNKEMVILDSTDKKDINGILEGIGFLSGSQNEGSIDITTHINYAWENSPLAEKIRKRAIEIFDKTDILVIIGYSFPNFNKDIDKLLFEKLKGRKTTIYYQDPNASDTFLKQLINPNEVEIICEKKKLDHFILPYEF